MLPSTTIIVERKKTESPNIQLRMLKVEADSRNFDCRIFENPIFPCNFAIKQSFEIPFIRLNNWPALLNTG